MRTSMYLYGHSPFELHAKGSTYGLPGGHQVRHIQYSSAVFNPDMSRLEFCACRTGGGKPNQGKVKVNQARDKLYIQVGRYEWKCFQNGTLGMVRQLAD